MSKPRTADHHRPPADCAGKLLEKDLHFRRLEMMERMEGAFHGGIAASHGQMMEIYISTKAGIIVDASFFTNGGCFSVLFGYQASKLAIGKTSEEALEIDEDAIIKSVGTVPKTEMDFAHLAAEALHSAIHGRLYSERGTAPGGEKMSKTSHLKSGNDAKRERAELRAAAATSHRTALHSGSCICPECGHHEPRVRGTPCAAISCPRCGYVMRRLAVL